MKKSRIIILLLILNSISFSQKKYFVAKDGTGNFSTIAQVNSASLISGDIVSFKSGQRFADAVLNCKKGVTYTSYGSGQAILGDSTSELTSTTTIQVDVENVTIDNLKIYGYKNSLSAISYTKGYFTIEDCEIIGGQNAHNLSSNGIAQGLVPSSLTNITIQRNKIYDWKSAILLDKPYNVEIAYNVMNNLWRVGAVMDGGGSAINRRSHGDGNSPVDVWDAQYTYWVHHNDVHHFEYVAFQEAYSRTIYEYNEIHHNLDERIYRGGVKHGSVGKMWDNTNVELGTLGVVFRYNYVHDLIRRGEGGYSYGVPNASDYVTGVYTGQITSNTYGRAVYLYAASPYSPSYGLHFGDRVQEGPDEVISGMGYANNWLHNNIFYNCSNGLTGRSRTYVNGSGEQMPWNSQLGSYFINNTVINCGWQGYITDNGLIVTQWDSQSPFTVINNIFDYTFSSARQLLTSKEQGLDLDYNIYLNQSGIANYSNAPSPSANKATYFENTASNAGAHELYLTDPNWNDTSSTIFNDSIGVAGAYIPDCRLTTGGAYNTGKAYSLLGDAYTINATYWSETHTLGQDPTGRSFAYDIFGNLRTTNDIGAVGAVDGDSRFPDSGLRLILEGSFINGSMLALLNSSKLLPVQQPYNVSPWNLGDNTAINIIPSNCVDWILVELRDNLIDTKYSKAAILTDEGKVVNSDGSSLSFSNISSGQYYIVIRHRNHLDIMSAEKVQIENNKSVDYNFTDSQTKAYGGNAMVNLGDGKFAMIAGDGDANGVINVLDFSTVANNILFRGYAQGDTDMNGSINVLDYAFISRNILKHSQLP